VNLGQLSGYVQNNKPVVLGVAAAGVAGLALLQRRKAGAGPAATVSSGRPAGTIPAAAVVPSQQTASTYDSSAYDVYNALTGQLGALAEQVRQTTGGGSTTAAPTPVASSLFSPNMTGRYVAYQGNGTAGSNGIYEVESDGSLYHLDMPEWLSIINAGGGKAPAATTFSGTAPAEFAAASNLQQQINKAAGVS
jgi:hypothetical protein